MDTVIQAINKVASIASAAAPQGVSGSVQLKLNATSFGFANGFKMSADDLEVPGVMGSKGGGANVFSGSINAAGLTSSAGVQGTVGTFSSTLHSAGLTSSAGVKASSGEFTANDVAGS